ncbi:MAG TPA: family 16 glycosylhydrolase [Bryobacteraceae bacterium]|nr:family 16 glycosylhydrolase [Bryobacteraceae bacterium]
MAIADKGHADTVLFNEPFAIASTQLDLSRWTTERGPSSYLGRTQLADWVTPGGVGQFIIDSTGAQLALNTFNPTGSSMYGTHAKTLRYFQPGTGSTIILTARLRLTSLQRGLVYGIYFYGCSDQATCATNHDEIDIELVTNLLQPGAQPSVQLNSYAAEPLGTGSGDVVSLPAGFDPLAAHDWTIRWSRQTVDYLVDGVLLESRTTHVPAGPMQTNLIAWAPDSTWPQAYSATLQQAGSAAQNQRFTAAVRSVTVAEAGSSTASALLTEYQAGDPADLEGITAGPDGAVWFTQNTRGMIGRISTSGAITKYPIGSVFSAVSITAGPDGALWFAGGCVSRITTAGVITPFCSAGGTYGIAAGADGAMWFTKPGENKIGRITTQGAITDFAIPTAGSQPYNIVAGADGALWFNEAGANKIGRITTNGLITEFPVARTGIGNLVSGPDRAIWFTLQYGGYIERITASGVVSEYPISSFGESYGITSGPDGALWFGAGQRSIGRITTGGAFTHYAIPSGVANPVFITTGPDGAIWFTENATGRVGRLNLASGAYVHDIADAASYDDTAVAPGEIVTLFGAGMGPTVLAGAAFDANGRLASTVAGARVLFDGVPAPLLYVSGTQSAAVVPYEVAGEARTAVTVEYGGITSAALSVAVKPAHPGLFSQAQSGLGQGAIYNEDGTLNGVGNAAAKGSVVVLYGTGEGQTVPGGVDGQVATGSPPKPVLAPTVTIGGVPATDIRYYGAVPGQAAGVFQINVIVPAGLAQGGQYPVLVQFGSVSSQAGLTISVR